MKKRNENLAHFLISLGICGIIAGIGLLVFGTWEGVFSLSSGGFVSAYGFMLKGKNNQSE